MKKSSIFFLLAVTALVSCKKSSVTEAENGHITSMQKKPVPTGANAHLMSGISAKHGGVDIAYSRACTPWGGGCCLRLAWWEELELRTGSFDQMVAINNASAGNSEHGLIVFSVANDRMRLSFFRDLEESTFRLDSEVKIEGPLAEYLGFISITLRPGSYELDRSRLQHGEAIVDAIFE